MLEFLEECAPAGRPGGGPSALSGASRQQSHGLQVQGLHWQPPLHAQVFPQRQAFLTSFVIAILLVAPNERIAI
jgi:hypothetical protein